MSQKEANYKYYHSAKGRAARERNRLNRNQQRRDRTLIQYGLDRKQFNEKLASQNGLCLLCGDKIVDRPVVDHCHSSGRVRGILHSNCNILLGMAKDDAEILSKAIKYLAQY